MKTKIFFLVILVTFVNNVAFSQNNLTKNGTAETVGAGVIDFLLSNPKTASKFNATEETALSTLGDILRIFGERKHEVNVATAGKDQITINTSDGRQITAVADNQGNMYLLKDGVIYPIAQSLVNQAKDYVLNQQPGYMDYVKNNSSINRLMLPDYNVSQLENEWDKEPTKQLRYIVLNGRKYLYEILREFNLKEEDLYCEKGGKFWPSNHEQEYWPIIESTDKYIAQYRNNQSMVYTAGEENYAYLRSTFSGVKSSYLYMRVINSQTRGTFTAKWVKDVNGDGNLEFDEFQDVRRNFFQKESFIIAAGLYSQSKYNIKLTIYEQLTGNIVYTNEIGKIGRFTFPENSFKPGIYTYYVSFIDWKTNRELGKLSEKFQILPVEQVKVKEKETTPQMNAPQDETSAKAKMMNDLIQLLKEGKISEETFKSSMKALEKN